MLGQDANLDRLLAAPALPPEFFARPTLDVAPDLLGKLLVSRRGASITGGRIVEVEAYLDAQDLASHAAKGDGPTRRNSVMYGPPGRAYVYLIYGMHHCFNVVTERDGVAGAVLVRALEPMIGVDEMRRRRGLDDPRALASGPGKLCAALAIDRRDDRRALDGSRLRIVECDRDSNRPLVVARSSRIGVEYAGAWADRPYRFFVRDCEWVSGAPRKRRALP